MDSLEIDFGASQHTLGADVQEVGIMIAINSSGVAYPADNTANRRVIGSNREMIGLTGEKIVAKRGIFSMENSNSHPVTKAHIGTIAKVEDKKTVSVLGSLNNDAGKIVDLNEAGDVFIDFN